MSVEIGEGDELLVLLVEDFKVITVVKLLIVDALVDDFKLEDDSVVRVRVVTGTFTDVVSFVVEDRTLTDPVGFVVEAETTFEAQGSDESVESATSRSLTTW